MRFLFIALILLMPAGYASAIFYNNTETIEIGDGVPPEPSPDSTDDTGTVNPGSGSSGSGGSGSSSSTGGGSSGGGSSMPPAESGTGSSDTGEETGSPEDGVVDALIAGGALTGVQSGANASGQGAGASGATTIRIVGAKVRQALSLDLDLKDILTYWRKGKGKASDAELGLIAASTALRDTNMQEVSFTASSFEIVYRSRGYLLAVIPWSFPVRLTVIPQAPVIEERVKVVLPWYRFFVRKFFTVKGLQKDVDDLLTKTKDGNTDGDIDETALLFEATAQFLRMKVGTVADSVLLGN